MNLLQKIFTQKEVLPLEEAQKEYDRFKELKSTLEEKQSKIETDINRIENNSGTDILEGLLNDNDIITETAGQLAELEAQQKAVNKAIDTATVAINQAEANLWKAQAADNRQQAEQLEKEAAEIESKVAELLQPVEELQGVKYEPTREVNEKQAGPGIVSVVNLPKSATLKNKAHKLRKSASKLEAEAKKQAQNIKLPELKEKLQEVI